MRPPSDLTSTSGDSLPDLADGFRLAGWDVDPRRNRARHGDHVEQIEPKVMQVVLVLARHAGQPVTRDLLMEIVWPDVIVTDDTLTRCISEARKIFDRPTGDKPDEGSGSVARSESVIETLPKVGYSLVAPVELRTPRRDRRAPAPGNVTVRPTAASDSVTTDGRSAWIRVVAVLVVIGAISAAVVAGARLVTGTDDPVDVYLGGATPATSFAGTESMPAWSPGGEWLAFVHTPESGDVSVLMAGEAGDPQPIELFEARRGSIRSPAWMPGGDTILFVHVDSDDCRIRSVPALGGPSSEISRCRGSFTSIDVSPDGSTIAMDDWPSPDAPVRIDLYDITSGERTTIPNDHSDRHDYSPVFSPDGRSVVFARSLGEGQVDLFEYDRSSATVERLTFVESGIAGHDLDATGEWIYFSQAGAGGTRLHVLDRTSGSIQDLSVDGVRPAVAGSSIAYEVRHVDSDIIVDDGSGAQKVCDSTRNDRFPALDPSGRFMTFVSDRAGAASLYRCDLVTGRVESVEAGEHEIVLAPQVGPDGRIAFAAVSDGEANVFVIDRPGDDPRQLTSAGSNDVYPVFSPDGTLVYFSSDRSGDMDIWRMAVGGGETERITRSGGMVPRLSPDGSTLYFQREGVAGLWRLPLDGVGTERTSPPGSAELEDELIDERIDLSTLFSWIPTADGIVIAERSEDGVIGLELLDPDTGSRELLRSFTEGRPSYGFAASPDLSVVALSVIERVDSDLMTATIPSRRNRLDSDRPNR